MNILYINPETKQKFTFDCQSCNDVNQTNKIIRNMVRMKSSLYTMNLATCNVYNNDNSVSVLNWNQYSDRNIAHVQKMTVPSRGNSVKYTVTRCRPGASCPGGVGVDVKHGSYDRRLARLKGKTCSKKMVSSCNTTPYVEPPSIHVEYEFSVGDFCWALIDGLGPFFKAIITNISGDDYTIQFLDSPTLYIRKKSELLIYACSC